MQHMYTSSFGPVLLHNKLGFHLKSAANLLLSVEINVHSKLQVMRILAICHKIDVKVGLDIGAKR